MRRHFRMLLSSVLTALVFASTALPSNAATAPGAVAITGLHVVGNQVLNDSNQVVTLRGVDRSGAEYMCLSGNGVFDGPADQASVDAMKAWGVNVVRLPVNEDCWLGINGKPAGMTAAQYRAAIVQFVGLLNNSGMAAIIDLQWAAPGAKVANALTPMPDADHAPAFWQSVAQTFGSNGAVIFDLFNEPYPDNNADTPAAWTCLLSGGSCSGVDYQAAGMQSLVDAIRGTGATNIIQVPGVQYTNVLSHWLEYRPVDPLNNLIADWHSYSEQICNNSACWNDTILPVLGAAPLVATEIGERDCGHQYIDPLMAFLDAHGGGYLGWAWNTYDCSGFPALISDYHGTPTGFGAGFKQHLLAAPVVPQPAAPARPQPATAAPTSAPALSTPSTSTPTGPLQIDLGGGTVSPGVAAPGDQVSVRQDSIGDANGTVLVKFDLLDANNTSVLEVDVPDQQVFVGSVLPTIADIVLPPDLPAGRYMFTAAVYSPDGSTLYGSNSRVGSLTVTGEAGDAADSADSAN